MTAHPGIELTRGVPLSQRTTLRLGGPALAEALVRSDEGLAGLAGVLRGLGGTPLALGGGSNILAADGELPLVLVRPGNRREPAILDRDRDQVRLLVPAGLRLPALLSWAAGAGLSGLEGLTGIPGAVGGAVAMNAGSYGCEMAHTLTRVRLWTPERGDFWVEAGQCRMGYRTFVPQWDGPDAPDALGPSGAPGFFLIWEAELTLTADRPETVRARMSAAYVRKKASQPVTARTCGCAFKNPQGASAGWLLDQCGFKGRREGGMALSERHANFLVNLGGGTAAQALALLDEAREAVSKRFGVALEAEVRMVP